MRMIMLISSLRLIGHKFIDPIFVSICGLLQAISVVFKSMKGKKKFYKMTVKDVDEQGHHLDSTTILTQKEFESRDRSYSQLSLNARKQASIIEEQFLLDDRDTSPQTPPSKQKDNEIEENKPVDDVYDSNAVKQDYELLCLRKQGVLDYMSMMLLQ